MAYNVNHLLRVGDAKTIHDAVQGQVDDLKSAITQLDETLENPIMGSASGTNVSAWAKITLFDNMTIKKDTKYIFEFTLPSKVTDVTGYAYLVDSNNTQLAVVSLANTLSASILYITNTELTGCKLQFAFGAGGKTVNAVWRLFDNKNALDKINDNISDIYNRIDSDEFIIPFDGATGPSGEDYYDLTNNGKSTNAVFVDGHAFVHFKLTYDEPQYPYFSHVLHYKDGTAKRIIDIYETNTGKFISCEGDFETTDDTLSVAFTYYAYSGASLEIKVTKDSDKNNDSFDTRAILPNYYKTIAENPVSYDAASAYVDNKIAQIPNGMSFLFFTDTHWETNSKKSPLLLKYVQSRTGISKVLWGGDFINLEDDNKYLAKGILTDFVQPCLDAFKDNFIPCVGNHDTNLANYQGNDKKATYLPFEVSVPILCKDLRNRVSMKNEFYGDIKDFVDNHVTLTPDDLTLYPDKNALLKDLLAYFDSIYYVDDVVNKTRYIVINTGNPMYGAVYTTFGIDQPMDITLQLNWFAYVLKRVPKGYNVVLLGHYLITHDNNDNYDLLTLAKPLARIFRLYAIGASGVVSVGTSSTQLKTWCTEVTTGSESYVDYSTYINVTYDFTSRENHGVLLGVCGHMHRDAIVYSHVSGGSFVISEYDDSITLDQSTSGEIPYIATSTDSSGLNPASMTDGTVTEQRFDVYTIGSTKISMTRFGDGSNREVKIS